MQLKYDLEVSFLTNSHDHFEQAVERLPYSELAEFRGWFAQFNEVAWDARLLKWQDRCALKHPGKALPLNPLVKPPQHQHPHPDRPNLA